VDSTKTSSKFGLNMMLQAVQICRVGRMKTMITPGFNIIIVSVPNDRRAH
jgi:hypothetical protein